MTPDHAEEPPYQSGGLKMGVIGGGTMGAGIAQAYLVAGWSVVLVEVDAETASAGHHRILGMLQKSAERGAIVGEVDELMDRLTVGWDLRKLAGSYLVVEAAPEKVELKASVLAATEEAIDEGAVLATNTSSISIDELAGYLKRPERFLGLHFFNPVPLSLLVEVVCGKATDSEVVATAQRWVRAIGKEPVVVGDSPGFASSRLGVLLGLEAIRMVEEGVATPENIDKAMTLGYKHPIGPLHLTDLVGLDVRLGIAEYLCNRLGERFAPPELLRSKVAAGQLGRKTGRGFFTYD
jgi:3-hydroxybutyryl-CoA dehydrogenase